MLSWLSNEPNDHFSDIEKRVQQRAEAWRKGEIEPQDRMISLLGYPGIGKTWLLEYLAKKQQGVYLDLGKRLDHLPNQFVKLALERLETGAEKSKRLLLLDNIPAPPDDDHILEFEQEILLPYWQAGALVIQCQTRRETAWGGRVPHIPPLVLPGLSEKGLKDLRSLHSCAPKHPDAEAILFSSAGHIPLLVKKWCAAPATPKELETILAEYLLGWWKAVSDNELPDSPTRHLRLFAYQACANRQDYATMRRMIEKAGLEHEYNSPSKLETKLRNWFWLNPDLTWYEPARRALKAWLFFKEPGVYQVIEIGG